MPSVVQSVQLASLRHAPQRLDTAVHRHLRALPMLIHELYVLLTALCDLLVPPFERVCHIVVALSQARAVGDCVRDERAAGLPKIHLHDPKSVITQL